MLENRIPAISAAAAIGTQRVVHETGHEIEFLVLRRAEGRRDSGHELSMIEWRVDRRDPYKGAVGAGAYYTRFAEYGTVNEPARPILGPVAEEVFPRFEEDVARVWRRA